jgi:thiopeptide-type bacteriocin biosynthesis protein
VQNAFCTGFFYTFSLMKKKSHWISLRIFQPEPHDSLLRDIVLPFWEAKREEKVFSKAFFIRYSEGGSHLRLYFLSEPVGSSGQLEGEAKAWFAERLPEASVLAAEREVEWGRFAGEKGMQIAEEQFQFSSELTLALLSQNREIWSYDLALALAMQMQLTLALGFGLERNELPDFFARVSDFWLPFAFSEDRQVEALNVFEKAFSQQKEVFYQLCRECFQPESPWNAWQQGNTLILLKLKQAWEEGSLDASGLNRLPKDIPAETISWEIVRNSLLNEFIHLHHNRLGILNHDEPYLAYLLARSLS